MVLKNISVKNSEISFVIPARKNIKYLKWAIESIRKVHPNEHYICIADDASNDGTKEYIVDLKKRDDKIKLLINNSSNRYGHCILYDEIIKQLVTTDWFFIYHSDMFLEKDCINNLLKHINSEKDVITATRIEPPIHIQGNEKIQADFGLEPEEFNEEKFNNFCKEQKTVWKNKTTKSFFAPWLCNKKEFLRIGGHSRLYFPQSREDSQIGNRFILDNFNLIQSRDAFVYHLTMRGSRRNPNLTGIMQDSSEWIKQNKKAEREFIREWQQFISTDEWLCPVVKHKYDIGFIIFNCNIDILNILEPWCSNILIETNELKNDYIKQEQNNTFFDLSTKIASMYFEDEIIGLDNDITIQFDAQKLNNNNIQFLFKLSEILTDSGQVGKMEYDIFKFNIKSMKTYEQNLIYCDNSKYEISKNLNLKIIK